MYGASDMGGECKRLMVVVDLLWEVGEELTKLEKTHGVLDKHFFPSYQYLNPSLTNVMEEELNGRHASLVKEGGLSMFADTIEDHNVAEVQ